MNRIFLCVLLFLPAEVGFARVPWYLCDLEERVNHQNRTWGILDSVGELSIQFKDQSLFEVLGVLNGRIRSRSGAPLLVYVEYDFINEFSADPHAARVKIDAIRVSGDYREVGIVGASAKIAYDAKLVSCLTVDGIALIPQEVMGVYKMAGKRLDVALGKDADPRRGISAMEVIALINAIRNIGEPKIVVRGNAGSLVDDDPVTLPIGCIVSEPLLHVMRRLATVMHAEYYLEDNGSVLVFNINGPGGAKPKGEPHKPTKAATNSDMDAK